MRGGRLEEAINNYKYEGRKGWATIFGRVIVGFLNENVELATAFDLITPTPTFVSEAEGERKWDHVRRIVEKASEADEDGRWPFHLDPPLVEKTAATPKLMKAGSWAKRRDIAVNQIRPALSIPDPQLVTGKRILVIDDVFTEGLNLNEVARALVLAGAEEVCGLTLSRQPWRG